MPNNAPVPRALRHQNKPLLLKILYIAGPVIVAYASTQQWLPESVRTYVTDNWEGALTIIGMAAYGWDKATYRKAMDAYDAEVAALYGRTE